MTKLVRRAKADNGGETVTMSLRTFEKLLESALRNFFSGDAYLEKYTDIREAAKRGKITSPLQHFVTNGYFEGRMAMSYNVDEDWYLLPWPLPKIAPRLQAADLR